MEPSIVLVLMVALAVLALSDNLSDMWADVIFGVTIRPANNTNGVLIFVSRFRFVNEDEEDVMGPITIMLEIKDAVQDEKLHVSNKNRCKSKKEMEPAADACASMAALAAASLADAIFGVSIRPANNTVWYRSYQHKFTLCLWQLCRLGVGDGRRYMGFNMERILSTLMVLSTVMFQGVLIFVSRSAAIMGFLSYNLLQGCLE
ncbi:hypothetical protein Tco_1035706 [Tanacetum coccineum]